MAGTFGSVQDYFDTLEARFQADKADGVEAVIQWNIAGPKGGDWHVLVKDGGFELQSGSHTDPSVAIAISDDNWVKLINGDLNGPMAVMTRKMKVNGNIRLARKMDQMFPLA